MGLHEGKSEKNPHNHYHIITIKEKFNDFLLRPAFDKEEPSQEFVLRKSYEGFFVSSKKGRH